MGRARRTAKVSMVVLPESPTKNRPSTCKYPPRRRRSAPSADTTVMPSLEAFTVADLAGSAGLAGTSTLAFGPAPSLGLASASVCALGTAGSWAPPWAAPAARSIDRVTSTALVWFTVLSSSESVPEHSIYIYGRDGDSSEEEGLHGDKKP